MTHIIVFQPGFPNNRDRIITARKRSLVQGNICTCLSFCSQGGVPDQVHPPRDQVHPPPSDQPGTTPQDQVHPQTMIRYTPPGPGTPPWDQVHPPGPSTPPGATSQVHPLQ